MQAPSPPPPPRQPSGPPAPMRVGMKARSGRKRLLDLGLTESAPAPAPAPVPVPGVPRQVPVRVVQQVVQPIPRTPIYAPHPLADLLSVLDPDALDPDALDIDAIERDETEY